MEGGSLLIYILMTAVGIGGGFAGLAWGYCEDLRDRDNRRAYGLIYYFSGMRDLLDACTLSSAQLAQSFAEGARWSHLLRVAILPPDPHVTIWMEDRGVLGTGTGTTWVEVTQEDLLGEIEYRSPMAEEEWP